MPSCPEAHFEGLFRICKDESFFFIRMDCASAANSGRCRKNARNRLLMGLRKILVTAC